MAVRLLLLAALCGLAACQTQTLHIFGNTFLVEMDEGKGLEPMYLLKKQYIVAVQCTMLARDNSVLIEPSIMWHKYGSNETMKPNYHDTSSLSDNKKNFTSVLEMRRLNNEDVVNYTCTGTAKNAAGPVTAIAQVLSRPLISFSIEGIKSADVSLWPGEGVNIKCIVDGNPHGSVEWFKEANGQVESLVNGSVLNLTNLSYETDRGFVSCRSHNQYGLNSGKIFLRIKHPKAYLTPLLIIIGELVVIGFIVAGYEFYQYKRRSARERQERTEATYKAD